ncbi:helix-turn-helix domain-containing protein [Desulfovibrio aminophilus]|uniref:helix-turn-helix domain-containing protein n=1 Tax=Desulfovibrio aminophilus TaxID=81425 RepID=UPI003397AD9A
MSDGLGERIRAIRGETSQEEFAAEMGISKTALGFYERNERVPRATFVAELCRPRGISLDWLLYGEGAMRQERRRAGADELAELRGENRELRAENRELRMENRELRAENRTLHAVIRATARETQD